MRTQSLTHALDKRYQQGSILVPVIIIAIIIVLVLMWQAGMFSSTSSSPSTSTNLQQDTTVSTTPTEPTTDLTSPDAQGLASPVDDAPLGPDATPAQIAERKARDFMSQVPRTGDGDDLQMVPANASGDTASAAAIEEAAALLIANHAPNFSACRSAGDAGQNLECAAAEQTRALQSAFQAHNEQRTSGDSFAVKNGTAIMQKVVEHMQNSLTPFVEAADGI